VAQTRRRGKPGGRKHGLSTEQFPVSAYVGSSKNLSSKNLKDLKGMGTLGAPDHGIPPHGTPWGGTELVLEMARVRQ